MKSVIFRALPYGLLLSVAMRGQEQRPNAEQQAELLAGAARYAEHYVNSLPNFVCIRVNEQYAGNKAGEKWKQGDTLTARLEWRDGHEKRTLVAVNNRPLNQVTRRPHTPLTTEGEFGTTIAAIFSDGSNAAFDWNRWDKVGNTRVAVFSFVIDKDHSGLSLSDELAGRFTMGYHGFVALEEGSGVVRETNVTADDIPKALKTRALATTIHYDDTMIGSTTYVLPARATVLLTSDHQIIRNELKFEAYRKFEAESTIKFDSGDTGASTTGDTPTTPH